ncbi:MAG: uroporphyrinogen-III C-methyltransferase [Betaproteobacteria bacterium]|nr:uroporphyrinogen-III C-methyltransferase [Betaproteobacteria bacterium]
MNDPSPIDSPSSSAAARESAAAGPGPAPPVSDRGRFRRSLGGVALIALAALALAVWQWHDTRGQLGELRQELARRLADADSQAKASRLVAEQAREATTEAQVKIGVLENKIAESQSQQIALEALYQELSRNRDEWGYAEIEQSLLIASQQLQLAGNVKAALIALQNADMRLQRMERPQLTALRKTLNRDMERLKALPHVDTVGISIRLDNLIATVDRLPLAMEVRPPAQVAADNKDESNVWTRLAREAWTELRQLVRIQHMDKPDVPLLAPQQSFFLRENLKLRLIGARLALLGRDEASYKADLQAAREWLERYYDTRNNSVIHATSVLRNLHSSEISIEVPDISATLDAVRNLRPARERGTR